MSRKRNRFVDDIAGCGDDNEDDEDGLEEENACFIQYCLELRYLNCSLFVPALKQTTILLLVRFTALSHIRFAVKLMASTSVFAKENRGNSQCRPGRFSGVENEAVKTTSVVLTDMAYICAITISENKKCRHERHSGLGFRLQETTSVGLERHSGLRIESWKTFLKPGRTTRQNCKNSKCRQNTTYRS